MYRKLFVAAIVTSTLIVTALFGPGAPAGATTPRTALIIGDSLTYESRFQLADRFALRTVWAQHTQGVAQTAPCDWLNWLPSDLATYQPSIVGLLTAGNTGPTPCMTDATGAALVTGSTAYYDRYRADLAAFFAAVTATGARVVFFSAPPFTDPARNAAAKQITTIATQLAYQYHGVSIAGSVRTALSNSGTYAPTKPCLTTETVAMGCNATTLRIPIRTVSGFLDYGLHLCPTGLPAGTFGICSTYSSGEYRFARAMTSSLISPPPPKLL